MSAEEKISLNFEAVNAAKFTKEVRETEIALRRQARTIDDHVRELQKEKAALAGMSVVNKDRVRALSSEITQQKLASAEIKAKVRALKEESSAMRSVANESKVLQAASTGLAGSFKSLAGVFSALTALFSAGAILKTAERFNQLSARVRNSLDDVAEFSSTFKQLIDSSNRTGTSIDAVAQAFVRLRPAAAELGVTNDKLIKFNETFVKMGALAGATSEEVKNSMIQLSQGIASGALRGDELRSVMEQMPQVARTIAQSMGIPFQEFRKAAEEGKISAEAVFKAILDQADKVDEQFSKLPASIERSINRIVNSVTLFVGKFNDAVDITGSLAKIMDEVAKAVDGVTDSLSSAMSPASQFISLLTDLVTITLNLIKTIVDLVLNVDNFFKVLFGGVGVIDIFSNGIKAAVQLLDLMVMSAQMATTWVGNLINKMRGLPESGDIMAIQGAYEERTRNRFGLVPKNRYGTLSGLPLLLPKQKKKPSDKPNPRGAGGSSGGGSKARKGASVSNIEDKMISNITKDLSEFRSQLGANFDLAEAQLGPFAATAQKLRLQLQELGKEQAKIIETETRLKEANVKTKEGIEKKKEALDKLTVELTKNQAETVKAVNEIEKLNKQIRDQQDLFVQGIRQENTESALNVLQSRIEETKEVWSEAYAQNQIDAETYYSKLNQMDAFYTQGVLYNIDEQIKAIESRIETLTEEELEQGKLLELEKERLSLVSKRADVEEKAASEVNKNARQQEKDLAEFGNNLESQTKGAIQQAIVDAFGEDGPIGALKKFAKRLKDIIINALAEALAEKITNSLKGVFQKAGGVLNAIAGRTGKLSLSPGGAAGTTGSSGGLSSLLGKIGGKGTLIGAGIGALAGGITGQITGNKGLSAGVGLLGGAAAGFAFGGPIGAVVGGLVGGISGFFSGGSKKKQKEQQKKARQLAQAQSLADAALAGADSSNLIDLENRMYGLLRNNKGFRGDAVRVIRAAAEQLQALIEARKKAIAEAIKEIKLQNEELAAQISLIGADSGTSFEISRNLALKKIEFETAKLLEEFKDSEEMKTKILEQESLKRQLMNKQEQDSAKSAVEDLRDLLIQRDDISNQNVFKRLRSKETQKADQLTDIDREIADRYLELQKMISLGVTPLSTLGLNQVVDGINRIGTVNSSIQILINEANDPAAVREEVTRALDSLYQKLYGVRVA